MQRRLLSNIHRRHYLRLAAPPVDPAHFQRCYQRKVALSGAERVEPLYLKPTQDGIQRVRRIPKMASGMGLEAYGWLSIPEDYLIMPMAAKPKVPAVEAHCACGGVVMRSLEQLQLARRHMVGCLTDGCPHTTPLLRWWHNTNDALALQHITLRVLEPQRLSKTWGGTYGLGAETTELDGRVAFIAQLRSEMERRAQGRVTNKPGIWVQTRASGQGQRPPALDLTADVTFGHSPCERMFKGGRVHAEYAGQTYEVNDLLDLLGLRHREAFWGWLDLTRQTFEEAVDDFLAKGEPKWMI